MSEPVEWLPFPPKRPRGSRPPGWGNEAEAIFEQLRGAHESQQSMLDAHAMSLANLAASKSPGMMDWAPGTYRAGWPAIYAGSLYIARETTTEKPVTGAPLAPVTNTDAWAHNGIANMAPNETVSLIDGAAASGANPTILERDTHTGLIGSSVSVDARTSDTSATLINRSLLVGVLDASKPLTTQDLSASASGFYGVSFSPSAVRFVDNGGTGTSVGRTGSGVGIFDWSHIGIQFAEADAANLTVAVLRDGVEWGRATIAKPNLASWRVAIGSRVAAALTATQHQVRGTPTLGQQSTHWRRIGAVADLT